MVRALAILVLLAATAVADPVTEAQRHVDRATELHGKDQFADAASELAIAYALDPKPELLYALGQTQVKLGNCGLAIAFYTRFLATNPSAAAAAQEAIAVCRTTQAASTPLAPKAEANRRIALATSLHQSNQFAGARGELVVAYALDPEPTLLFAIGQLHVKLEQCDQAILYYERFVASNPDVTAAADATQAIGVCQDRLAPPTAPPAPAPIAPLPPRVDRVPRWYTDRLGLGLAAGGVVLAAAAVFTYRAALTNLDDADAAATYEQHVELVDQAHGKRTLAVVFGAGAVALTGVAVVRFWLTRTQLERRSVAIVPTPTGGLVTLAGRF
ncbi:MAG: tetratricopeptide repeat protein [Kofleriaceae bacterium]